MTQPTNPNMIPRMYLDYLAQNWSRPVALSGEVAANPEAGPSLPLLPERSGSPYYLGLAEHDFVQKWQVEGISDDCQFIAKSGLDDVEVTGHLRAIMLSDSLDINHRAEALTWLIRMWVEEIYLDGKFWFAEKKYLPDIPYSLSQDPENVVQLPGG